MDFSFLFLLAYHKAVGHYGKSLGLYHMLLVSTDYYAAHNYSVMVWEECNAEQATLLP